MRGISEQGCTADGKQVRVLGILPDEASAASILLADGSREALDIVNNVYVQLFDRTAAKLPKQVEFDLAGKHQVVPVPVSSDVLSSTCGPPPGMKPTGQPGQ